MKKHYCSSCMGFTEERACALCGSEDVREIEINVQK